MEQYHFAGFNLGTRDGLATASAFGGANHFAARGAARGDDVQDMFVCAPSDDEEGWTTDDDEHNECGTSARPPTPLLDGLAHAAAARAAAPCGLVGEPPQDEPRREPSPRPAPAALCGGAAGSAGYGSAGTRSGDGTACGDRGDLIAGRYRVVKALRRSRFGKVWLVEDTRDGNRQAVIKASCKRRAAQARSRVGRTGGEEEDPYLEAHLLASLGGAPNVVECIGIVDDFVVPADGAPAAAAASATPEPSPAPPGAAGCDGDTPMAPGDGAGDGSGGSRAPLRLRNPDHLLRDGAGRERLFGVVLEYCEGGELFDFVLDRPRGVAPAHARAWLRQLLRALAAAHAKGVVNRDVSLENMLITGEGDLRMCDFGLAFVETPLGAEQRARAHAQRHAQQQQQ